MSSSINTTKTNMGAAFFKKTAGYISDAAGDYIKDVMPVTTSTISDAKSTVKEINSIFKNTTQTVFPKIKELKMNQRPIIQKIFDLGEPKDNYLEVLSKGMKNTIFTKIKSE